MVLPTSAFVLSIRQATQEPERQTVAIFPKAPVAWFNIGVIAGFAEPGKSCRGRR